MRVWLNKKSGLAGTGTTDYKNILISRILRLLTKTLEGPVAFVATGGFAPDVARVVDSISISSVRISSSKGCVCCGLSREID